MARRIPLARLELGAGAAAAVMGLLTPPIALLLPIYGACSAPLTASGACPGGVTTAVSLMATHPDGSVWALLITLLFLTLVGAAGAVLDARKRLDPHGRLIAGTEMLLLWGATVLVFAACVLGSRGPLGVLYLPSTLALLLAAYVALLRRLAVRRTAQHETEVSK